MKVNVDISYEVESDDPDAEKIGMQLIDEEAQAFALSIRHRFTEAGIEIKEFGTKAS